MTNSICNIYIITNNMKVENKPISELIPASYNPRSLSTTEYEHIKNSLENFGFVNPVVVNTHKGRENIIIGGHQRVKVWQDMGHSEVPVVPVDLDEDRERELNIRLNKAGGSWDWDVLANEFDFEKLMDWGFSPKELDFDDFGNDLVDTGEYDFPEGEAESSHVKMVQLYLSTETEPLFKQWELKLRAAYGTDNLTDTVYQAIKEAHEQI